jgi:hypothetical protein
MPVTPTCVVVMPANRTCVVVMSAVYIADLNRSCAVPRPGTRKKEIPTLAVETTPHTKKRSNIAPPRPWCFPY